VLVGVVAFLVLAGGGAVAAVKLAGGDDKGGGGSSSGAKGADPLGGAGNDTGGDQAGGGDAQPTGPAVAGQLTVNKTVWYGGKKFIINSASYDPTQDRPVSIDVKVENLSGEADNNARYTPTFLTYDGKTVQGRIGELDELLSKATSQAVITFDPDKPITNLKAATLTIGEEASVQAKVPLGDPAKAVSLEPKQVADAKAFTAGLLDFKFTKCEHRADFPDRHDQAKSGSYLIYCVFDVKYTKTSGSNYFAAKEGFRLKLPDGTITSSQFFRPPLMDPQEQVRDVPIGFEIRWPAPGNYVLMVHDAASYGQGQPGPGNLTEIPMTLS
jgi:hypothetical protein